MIITQVLCDVCGRPFRQHERCRDQAKEVTVTGFSRTKEWDTRKLFPHLCEGCAAKIDLALATCKEGMTTRGILLERYHELNEERKERLGTNG